MILNADDPRRSETGLQNRTKPDFRVTQMYFCRHCQARAVYRVKDYCDKCVERGFQTKADLQSPTARFEYLIIAGTVAALVYLAFCAFGAHR